MANTFDPRKFYRVTKAIVMPSLWNESFGLVAAEAMANGIPVLASNRGALPETVGLKKGDRHLRRMVLQMPLTRVPGASPHFFRAMEGCSSTSRPATRPTRGSCPPPRRSSRGWRRSCGLWDDEGLYRQQSEKALHAPAQWHPDRLRPLYVEFFRNVIAQPEPPVVRRGPLEGRCGRPGLRREHHAKRDEYSPYISVVTPVYNGAGNAAPSVRSVMAQTLANWELLLVDDCSTDGSGGIAEGLAAGDPRIRLIRKSENTGVGAHAERRPARAARGRVVTYLDRDDEYSPQYFARLAGLDGKADVFVFGYDFVYDDEPNRPPEECQPHLFRDRLMAGNIVTPLGVAHRREWIDKAVRSTSSSGSTRTPTF